jgi:hypothetical protein
VYLTSEDRLCLLDTAELEEADAADLGGARLVYASIVQGGTERAAPPPSTIASSSSSGAAGAAAGGVMADIPPAPLGRAGDPATALAINLKAAAAAGTLPPALKARLSSSFQNSFTVCEGHLYILATDRVLDARMKSWTERIDTMIEDGEWISALALALDHYEAVTEAHHLAIAGAEQRAKWAALKAQALVAIAAQGGTTLTVPMPGGPGGGVRTGVGPPGPSSGAATAATAGGPAAIYDPAKFEKLRAGPGPAGPGTNVGERLERILKQYLDVTINHPPEEALQPANKSAYGVLSAAANHWNIVAGICIDYCVTIKRPDLLFGLVYDKFVAAPSELLYSLLLMSISVVCLQMPLGVTPPTDGLLLCWSSWSRISWLIVSQLCHLLL